MPAGIGNLIHLEELNLRDNKLESLPITIINLRNTYIICLRNNKLKSCPVEILKIKEKITIDITSYDINNLNNDKINLKG